MGKKQKNVKLSIIHRQFIDLETKEVEYLYIALDERKKPIFAIAGKNQKEAERVFVDEYSTRMLKTASKNSKYIKVI